jgi:DNA-binding CsgD family transcriptional regulator
METRPRVLPLTTREREVADLVAAGLTNRLIAERLFISERTVDAHLQNILNKLGATNRAQVAAWIASGWTEPAPPAIQPNREDENPPLIGRTQPHGTAHARLFLRLTTYVALAAMLIVLIVGEHARPNGPDVSGVGPLVFRAGLAGDGIGFARRVTLGDPAATAITFLPGAVDLSVIPSDKRGYSETALAMDPLDRYYARAGLNFRSDSGAEFWIVLDGGVQGDGRHVVEVVALSAQVRLLYYVPGTTPSLLARPGQVEQDKPVREFTLAVRVDPPRFDVFVDGARVITVADRAAKPGPIRLAVFGEAPGTVRVTSIEVYALN